MTFRITDDTTFRELQRHLRRLQLTLAEVDPVAAEGLRWMVPPTEDIIHLIVHDKSTTEHNDTMLKALELLDAKGVVRP